MRVPSLRIGVDVGGTNTDGVILDPTTSQSSSSSSSPSSSPSSRGKILAWTKSPTTPNPSDGIDNAIGLMLDQLSSSSSSSATPSYTEKDISSVTIGTTHFINAVVEVEKSITCNPPLLRPVAVIRLAGPFSHDIPLGADWPPQLRDAICAYRGIVDGGLEMDGQLIAPLDEDGVRREAEKIKRLRGGGRGKKMIRSIVVVGVFSPIDVVYRQEQRAAEIIREVFSEGGERAGAVDVVCSAEVVPNMGFLERENAAVLNASILPFARRTISEFRRAVARRLGEGCPVFITQNDGTVLEAGKAAKVPIRTFSSGPTNSMRGAGFLVDGMMEGSQGGGRGEKKQEKQAMMIVDIGGTTTDVGLLTKSGFPRQAAAYSEVAGVRTNFSRPDVRSIGLGGGSIVRRDKDTGKLTVGPESVGYRIREKAIVFGGDVPTTTDYTIMGRDDDKAGEGGSEQGITGIGDPTRLASGQGIAVDEMRASLPEFQAEVKSMLEGIIDTMKTSPEDIPVVLVGGGAFIAPDQLAGASKVVKPAWAGVANAIGAAMARVSAVIDSVESTESRTTADILKELSARAVDRAVENGAARETVSVVEMDCFPLQYIADKCRVIVKAVGDFDQARAAAAATPQENGSAGDWEDDEYDLEESTKDSISEVARSEKPTPNGTSSPQAPTLTKEYIASYKPEIRNRQWFLSETDLEFISTGCYILGTGGGGSPYQHFLRLREMKRAGAVLRVISPRDLRDDDVVACGGSKGSPQVSIEKPFGDEILESQRELYAFLGTSPTAVIPLEIGGGNGLQGLVIGSSAPFGLDIPAIDGDWMGRAYPVSWQTTPVVYGESPSTRQGIMVPTCISDGNGRLMLMPKAKSELDAERALRAALSQMGSHVGCAKGPIDGKRVKEWVVENTMSLAWRIGRAVAMARCQNTVDTVAEAIIEEVGGNESARVLFRGKIVGVERVTRMGHAYGEVIIEELGSGGAASEEKTRRERMVIPFKNENIYAKKVSGSAEEAEKDKGEIVCMVPDLVCVLDAQNGEALGTQDYRYGLPVIVLGITASEKWTATPRALEIGGPKGFGFNDLEYKALGKFSRPRSVIDEFDAVS